MRPLGVVLLLPRLNGHTRVGKTAEPVQIKALISKLAVEAFAVGILRRLARLDEVQGDAVRVGPGIQRLASKFRPIVDGDLLGAPCQATSWSRTRVTRWPGKDVSTSSAKHSRVTRSSTFSVRKRRPSTSPSTSPSCMKSILQASPRFHVCSPVPRGGTATRLRLRLRNASRSSRESRYTRLRLIRPTSRCSKTCKRR
jgi:hypothetical protein